MQNIKNKEYYTLLGLTKQGKNDIIIIYEIIRNKNERRGNMKRRVCAILLAASLAVCGLTGCGNGSQSSAGQEKVRLMVWSPSEDQSKESGEWLQTMCESFAEENPQWDITFVYGVADEATAASQVSQDPEASADVFMYANDTLTTMTDANALAKFGGKYREEIEKTNSDKGRRSVRNSFYDKYLVYVL